MATQAEIAQLLSQSKVSVYGLKVDTAGGTTHVSGTVASESDREKVRQVVTAADARASVDLKVQENLQANATAARAKSYTVKSGDTLSKIAKEHFGDANKWHAIFEANRDRIKDPDKIQVGWELNIPEHG